MRKSVSLLQLCESFLAFVASLAKSTAVRFAAATRSWAWFGPDAMHRGIFSADPIILSEGLGESIEDLDLAIEEALGELARFSLIRLTPETVSVHRLLQASSRMR